MRILFIDIDTLRPDHMGCYGYSRNTTPNMDQVCRDIFLAFAGSNTVLLELTPLGQQYYDFYVEQYQSRLAEQLGDLSPEDIQTTIATIHRFYQVVRSCKTEESKT